MLCFSLSLQHPFPRVHLPLPLIGGPPSIDATACFSACVSVTVQSLDAFTQIRQLSRYVVILSKLLQDTYVHICVAYTEYTRTRAYVKRANKTTIDIVIIIVITSTSTDDNYDAYVTAMSTPAFVCECSLFNVHEHTCLKALLLLQFFICDWRLG